MEEWATLDKLLSTHLDLCLHQVRGGSLRVVVVSQSPTGNNGAQTAKGLGEVRLGRKADGDKVHR